MSKKAEFDLNNKVTLFSVDDQTRIASAINKAEGKTSGEIVAVVAAQSDNYLYAPILWAALVALFIPWPLIYFTALSMPNIYILQLVTFFILCLLFFPRSIRIWLVPPVIKQLRAKRRGIEQFLAQDLHTTHSRTGVLIFVSLAERFATIIPDTAIDEKVPQSTWKSAVDQLVAHMEKEQPGDGFVAAIECIGNELAKHFPPGTGDSNDLPNHLIILE